MGLFSHLFSVDDSSGKSTIPGGLMLHPKLEKVFEKDIVAISFCSHTDFKLQIMF